MKQLLIILSLFTGSGTYAGQGRIDSLKNALTGKEDSAEVNTLIALCRNLMNGTPMEALPYARKALTISEEIGHDPGVKESFLVLSTVKFILADYDSCLYYSNKALAISLDPKYAKFEGDGNMLIANSMMRKGDAGSALIYYQKALGFYSAIKDRKREAMIMNNIGNLYYEQGMNAEAKKFFLRSVDIRKDLNDRKGLADVYGNIGIILMYEGKLDSALMYHFDGLKVLQGEGFDLGAAQIYGNIAAVYYEMDEYRKSKAYRDSALMILEGSGDLQEIAANLTGMGQVYYSLDKMDSALYYTDSARVILDSIGVQMMLVNNYRTLAEIYSKMGRHDVAAKYLSEAYSLRDSLMNEESARIVSEMQEKYESEKKQQEIEKLNFEKESQKQIQILLFIIIGASIIAAGMFFKLYRDKRRNNLLLQEVNAELAGKNRIIEEAYKDIRDSIQYAKRIQGAILPSDEEFTRSFPASLVYYMPKDVVSGDFYWTAEIKNIKILAVADCTGHGVPGAFMSLLGSQALNQVIREKQITQPEVILEELDKEVRNALKQHSSAGDSVQDGMDILVCAFEKDLSSCSFAGANRPLLHHSDGTLQIHQTTKRSIGGSISTNTEKFTSGTITLYKGDAVYLFSDGLPDQFGGENNRAGGKKLMLKGVINLLKENHLLPPAQQRSHLTRSFDQWKGSLEQIDDVLLIKIVKS